ncbi:MAG: hypothetical protein RMJ18_03230, partial [Candidatus Aenigmarchaeota archaeon]|nr:class I SAM-dependent methyltransferase [Candidatus Aenigmarchaeota archaeon]MDW8160401.1 hypothetical protein [Candidatus Aenigmarchaeota archaeon]
TKTMLDGIPKREYPRLFYRYAKEFLEVLAGKTSLKLYLAYNYPSFYKAEFVEGEVLKWKGGHLPSKFIFESEEYNYFYHTYNATWKNERCIEVPIVKKIYEKYRDESKILELGNVFSHYFNVKHTIVDKYERAPNVINEDIVNFSTKDKYDLIFSISTLEHVGWDEKPREPEKVYMAISNLKRLLSDDGMLVVTVPLGYNPVIDDIIEKENKNPKNFTKIRYMKKITQNDWKQVEYGEVRGISYDFHSPSAKAVAICFYTKSL